MALDIICGVIAALYGHGGSKNGAMAALYRALIPGSAILVAKFLTRPTAETMLKAISWSPQFAYGIVFIMYFIVLTIALTFAIGAVIRSAEYAGDGGTFDRGMGLLLGLARGALVMYAVLAASVLMTHRLGAKKAFMAVPWHSSNVGRIALTRNLVEPEAFPNAFILRVVIGAEDNLGHNPNAIAGIKELPDWKLVEADPPTIEAIRNKDWKSLRQNGIILALITSSAFLQWADDYYTPRHNVEAEDPSKRFEELKSK